MGTLKQIKRNRLVYKYIYELKKVPYYFQEIQWWYMTPNPVTTIFMTNDKHNIITNYFSTMCEHVDIDLDDETYYIILQAVKDIHHVNKLR